MSIAYFVRTVPPLAIEVGRYVSNSDVRVASATVVSISMVSLDTPTMTADPAWFSMLNRGCGLAADPSVRHDAENPQNETDRLLIGTMYCARPSAATVLPIACAAFVVPSCPRITVSVVPLATVARPISFSTLILNWPVPKAVVNTAVEVNVNVPGLVVDGSTVNTELTISLFSAYGAFVPADELGVSGVLAVVACGVYLGFRASEIASLESRMIGEGLWTVLAFLLNAALFILIGLQLPVIVGGLSGRPTGEVVGYAAAVCAAVVAMRFLWTFGTTAIIRTLDRRPSQMARRSNWQTRVVSSWSGIRGAVSLAAALALPLETSAGDPLPGRELIQFITFSLILVTVVGQGLTLPVLIRRLGVTEDGDEESMEELRTRLTIAKAALARVDELEQEDWTRDRSVARARQLYEFRLRRFKIQAGKLEDDDGDMSIEDSSQRYQRMMHEIFAAQRAALLGLRDSRQVSSEILRRVEREIDLEEARLEI